MSAARWVAVAVGLGMGLSSISAPAIAAKAPRPPAFLGVVAGDGEVTLNWSAAGPRKRVTYAVYQSRRSIRPGA